MILRHYSLSRKTYSHREKLHDQKSKRENIAEERKSRNKALKAHLIGMKVKFHLSPLMNDGMSLSLTDKNHKSDNFSTINVFYQRV